ncbi:MAG: hypothetical protein WCO84_02655, partial [bacterium]
QEQKDRALEEVGLGNVHAVLDKIQAIKKLLIEEIPVLIKTKIDEVITPPGVGLEIKKGDAVVGNYKEKEMVPRLKMLLFLLVNDCHQEIANIEIIEGISSKNTVRKEPYVAVNIPGLSRMVVVCDEEGNRTDVFDTSHPQFKTLGMKDVLALTKEEKNDYGQKNPGSHIAIRYSDLWSDNIYKLITEKLPTKKTQLEFEEEKATRPPTLEIVFKADKDGFYHDGKGGRWGSVARICTEFFSNGTSMYKSVFNDLWSKQKKIRILLPRGGTRDGLDGFEIESVKKAMIEDPKLSVYFRRADGVSGIYIDSENKKWASLNKIYKLIGKKMHGNDKFVGVVKSLPNIQVLYDSNFAPSYDLDVVKEALSRYPEFKQYSEKLKEPFSVIKVEIPKTDKKTKIYTDQQGRRWGSLSRIGEEFFSNKKLLYEERFRKFIKQQSKIKILARNKTVDAFDIDLVKKLMMEDPEMSKYFK